MRIPENQEEAVAVRLVFGLRSAALKRVNEAQGQHESCLKAKCPELGVWCPAQLDLCALRESTWPSGAVSVEGGGGSRSARRVQRKV